MVVALCTPCFHVDVARQVNWAASGAPFSTSRASSRAWTLTPFSAVLSLSVAVMSKAPSLGWIPHRNRLKESESPAKIRRSLDYARGHGVGETRRGLGGECRDAVPRPARSGTPGLRPGPAPGPGRVRDLRHRLPGPRQRHPGLSRAEW